MMVSSSRRSTYFNPHTREGCDLKDQLILVLMGISIHTPVKGVTVRRVRVLSGGSDFNPHTREGCDLLSP